MLTNTPPQNQSNLCRQIYTLITHSCLDEAIILLEQHLSKDPISNKALLAWTRVQCAKGNSDLAIEKLMSPIKQFPQNPYFKLACLEIRLRDEIIPTRQLITLYRNIHLCAEGNTTELLADISAKIALSAALYAGAWSISLPCFLRAISLYAIDNFPHHQPEDLILLSNKNEHSLKQLLYRFMQLDHEQTRSDYITTLPIEAIGRLLCILITAIELDIPEAAPVINYIAASHPALNKFNYTDLVKLAIKYSPNWIALKLPYEFLPPIVVWN